MSYCWTNEKSNFGLQGSIQGNQSSPVYENNQKLNTIAYLNPHIVNYEFFKRSLCKNLQRSGKIHVNPNFRENGLDKLAIKNYPYMINTIPLSSHNNALGNPGPSKIFNALGKKNFDNTVFTDKERNVSSATVFSHQSRFKKVNLVNKNMNKSLYSWSNNKTERTDSNSYGKNLITTSGMLIDQKSVIFNNKKNICKYVSPKKMLSQTCQSAKNHLVFKSKTKIINESKTKLTNDAALKIKLHFTEKIICNPDKKHLSMSKFFGNKNKKSSVLMVAKAIRSKYKYLSNLEQYKKSKYKIDKRNKLSETVRNKSNSIKDIRKLFPNYFYNKVKLLGYNVYKLDKCHTVTKISHFWRKNQPTDKNVKKIVNHTPNRRVVNIGGILYKSTANKLTLANKQVEKNSEERILNRLKGKKYHVVYVRGEKFILENNGRALRRQSEGKEKTLLLTPNRIDIGGVTYMRKSHNVLIRTNVHQARHFVNKAKNKSIALLANLHKRSSMPCMIYHRFGRCIRHSKGLCMYKHDIKNIAICKKFLKGNCKDSNCLLSHQVIQEKMATCHFFLKGLCIREKCPFLHVKLNKNAAICEKFLQGFCNLGKDCTKRHLHQCPEFDKYGTCKLGSKCLYPHKKFVKANKSVENEVKNIQSQSPDDSDNQIKILQYYIKPDIQKKQKRAKKSGAKIKEVNSAKVQKKATKKNSLFLNNPIEHNDTIECFPKRIKLDKLPCFIPLSSDL